MSRSPLKIRAHHLLCIQGFQGYGYDSDFLKNMQGLAKTFRDEPERSVVLVEGQDDMCGPCPHNQNDRCQKDNASDQRMRQRDQALLDHLQLQTNTEHQLLDLLNQTKLKYKTQVQTLRVCFDCEWQAKCLWFQKF